MISKTSQEQFEEWINSEDVQVDLHRALLSYSPRIDTLILMIRAWQASRAAILGQNISDTLD